MAFISAIPSDEFLNDYLGNISYRGPEIVNLKIGGYIFTVGNYSKHLLNQSYLEFGRNNFIAFDTTPWACEKLLSVLFTDLSSDNDFSLNDIILKIGNLKADFHCLLFFENKLYAFHSLVSNRPFFYSCINSKLKVSSSLGSLRKLLDVKVSIKDLSEFLIPEYSNPYSTIWETIYRINPGYMVDQSGNLSEFQKFNIQSLNEKSLPELISEMKLRFENAVSRSIYGKNTILLSGGIDSSSIVCTALQKTKDLTAFSLVYNDQLKICDEQKYVDAIVDRYGLNVERLAADDLVPFSKVVDNTDEPELWPYTVRNYALLETIKAKYAPTYPYINVIAGEGGDELLLGQVFSVLERFDNVSWESGLAELLYYENDPGDDFKRTVESEAKIISLLASGYYDTDECLNERVSVDIPSWLTEEYLSKYDVRQTIKKYYPRFSREKGMTSHYSQFLFSKMAAAGQVECGGWHEDEILRFGLNASYPFVDYELAEFVWSLPAQYLRFEAKEKWILREALKEYIPSIINDRTDKTEATPMLDNGIKKNVARLYQINEESFVCKLGIVDYKKYREAIYTYLLGRKDLRVHLWATYTVEKWLERNLDAL